MKLVVLGGTGRTGRHLITQALARGDTIAAPVRNPAKLADVAGPQLSTHTVDLADAAQLEPLIAGHDAVVSALGPVGRGPSNVCASGTRAILAAMRQAGLTRLVVISVPVTSGTPGSRRHRQPSRTASSRGRVFNRSTPVPVTTTMSSIRAPYWPGT